jgi:large subunit ribosomal protein L18
MFADKAKFRHKARVARHERIRKNLMGTAERPRLCVRRSLNNMVAQLVDDVSGKSLLQISTLSPELKTALADKTKTQASEVLGEVFAKQAIEKGIKRVVFDRGGYLYHGRIKAIAEAARKAGLDF